MKGEYDPPGKKIAEALRLCNEIRELGILLEALDGMDVRSHHDGLLEALTNCRHRINAPEIEGVLDRVIEQTRLQKQRTRLVYELDAQ